MTDSIFSQRGHSISENEVEEIECKDHKTRFRLKVKKTWVKVVGIWKGEFYVKFSYKSQHSTSKNRFLDISFETVSKAKLSDKQIKDIAEKIMERKNEWFDFYNRVEIGESKQTIEKITSKKDIPNGEYEIESESSKDLHGW